MMHLKAIVAANRAPETKGKDDGQRSAYVPFMASYMRAKVNAVIRSTKSPAQCPGFIRETSPGKDAAIRAYYADVG